MAATVISVNEFEGLIMGIFTNDQFISVLTKEDRKIIIEYYVKRLSDDKTIEQFVKDLVTSYNMDRHPYSALKTKIVGGAVIKALSNAVEQIQITPENAGFLRMIFSIPLFADKRMDAVRARVNAVMPVASATQAGIDSKPEATNND